MRNCSFIALETLSAILACAASPAQAAPARAEALAEGAAQQLRAARAELGLDGSSDFQVKDALDDDLGLAHVRLQQTYRGLPVWGGQAIVHLDASGAPRPMTDVLVRGIQVATTPNLGPSEALAVVQDRLQPRGAYSDPPETELVIWPERPGEAPAPALHHLAWHVHAGLDNGPEETRREDALVDAHTGAVLHTWSTLLTARGRRPRRNPASTGPSTPTEGLGHSQYSGPVALTVQRTDKGFELTDPTRGGFTTVNYGGATRGPGAPYTRNTPEWGDGSNYDPGLGAASPNGETAAVDAHYGLQTTWDFCRYVLERNGIDGKGTGPLSRVHYGKAYANAFWDDQCFCMTFGDDPVMGPLTSLDVVGHEVSHGLCSSTADLIYSGESGGLNESNSDILGALITFYARGAQGKGRVVPDRGGAWTIGGEFAGKPFRFLHKPSLDGESPDAWSPNLKYMDVHQASGPMNRAFYFLAQGASPRRADETYTPYLPEGMRGIGNDRALRIWWRTLSTRLTPTSGYREAREGALLSAEELYGRGSSEAEAVDLAFRGINVTSRTPRPPMLMD